MPFFAIVGPRDAGPGERDRMLEAAATALEESGVVDHVRVDVPGRGAGEAGDGHLREPVHLVVPALQSGSLFGGGGGVVVVPLVIGAVGGVVVEPLVTGLLALARL